MTIKDFRGIARNFPEDTEILIRICGHNRNVPVDVDSHSVVKKEFDDELVIESLVLNCLETEEIDFDDEFEFAGPPFKPFIE